jgi:hypothetical protein
MAHEIKVDKAKFDALLIRLINTKPTTFKEVVAEPKRTKGGDVKLSSKKRKAKAPTSA